MIVAFLGPSLPASAARGVTVLPPARQGDVWRALALRPHAIALIDGVFESQPSVWHHELLDALDSGVAVFGGASMGALRAAELHQYGMVGVGQIFRWYASGEIIDDADVALLHADAEHGFRPLTVPQVNVRWAALQAVRARVLRKAEAAALIEASARIFYQERTWPRVLEALPEKARERWLRWTPPDLKADDACATIHAALQAAAPRAAKPRQPAPSSLVRRRKLPDLSKLWQLRSARALADAGLRRALLAGWARAQGLLPEPGAVAAAEQSWLRALHLRDRAALCRRAQLCEADVLRLCEDLALERLALDRAQRMLADGPSASEALAAEAALRGLGLSGEKR